MGERPISVMIKAPPDRHLADQGTGDRLRHHVDSDRRHWCRSTVLAAAFVPLAGSCVRPDERHRKEHDST
jgi:hypothetical protein